MNARPAILFANPPPDPSGLLRRRLRRILLLIVGAAVLAGSAMVWSLRMGQHLAIVHSSQVETLGRIQVEVAVGHLWFEELLTGDPGLSIDEIWTHFDTADRYLTALLEGGETPRGSIEAVTDPEIRAKLEELRVQLDLFGAAARQRFEIRSDAKPGSPLDQHFDEFFDRFLALAVDTSEQLHRVIESDLQRFRLVNGGLLAFSFLLALAAIAVLYRYETGRVEATRDLAASEHRYRHLFESIVDGVIIADQNDGSIRYANPAIRELLGYTMGELEQMTVRDLHPRVFDSGITNRLQAHSRGEPGDLFELNFIRKDGSQFPAEVSNSPVRLEGRNYSIGFIKDLTLQRKAAEEKEDLEHRLRQAQKMESIGNLAGGIAHDFNNLLQAILGYSEILIDGGNLAADETGDVQRIKAAADRAADLTRQLLAFSRRQLIAPQDLDMNEVIAENVEMLERLIGEGIELKNLPGNRLGTACVDRGQLEQVFMNLCLNARDAMDGRGTLTIETENVAIDAEYCIDHPWADPGRYVLLSVTDTGAGMDPEVQDQIFEPFYTTKEIGRGTGLGLSTVYGIVKQNSGLIHVYSEPDKGTTFKIYFPLVERPALEVGTKIDGTVPGGAETIFVAEDDPGVLELARRILMDAGYGVVTAADGEEAVEVFRAHSGSVDLALLDVVMPKLGGREVQERIRALRPDVKVLFASGYSENAIHTDFVLDEGKLLIQKPYRRNDLLRKVREVLDG